MPEPIELKITGDISLLKRLEDKGDALPNALMGKMNLLMYQLQARIQGFYLSGGALQSRTGKLRGSVNVEEAHLEGDRIVGGVTGAGGPAFYGVYFEKGGLGSYEIRPVDKKALSFIMNGARVYFAHVMHPPIPHLPWAAPALADMHDAIVSGLQETVTEVLRS